MRTYSFTHGWHRWDRTNRALIVADAWTQVQEWLLSYSVWTPVPTEQHAAILGRLLKGSSATSRLVNDTHLAALAIEHNLTLCSADSDFARLDGLKWLNPLKPD